VSDYPEVETVTSNESHSEAKIVIYTSLIVDDIKVNLTIREGATAEMVAQSIDTFLAGIYLYTQHTSAERVAAVHDGRDNVAWIKGASKKQDAPAPPPKPALKAPPAMPPIKTIAPSVPTLPEMREQTAEVGASDPTATIFTEKCFAISRERADGKISYACKYNLSSGAESAWPLKVYGMGINMLEKALVDAGHIPANWEIGEYYAVNVIITYKYGKAIPNKFNDKGEPVRYKDYVKFEIFNPEEHTEDEQPF
jgi:hypothetical protein